MSVSSVRVSVSDVLSILTFGMSFRKITFSRFGSQHTTYSIQAGMTTHVLIGWKQRYPPKYYMQVRVQCVKDMVHI